MESELSLLPKRPYPVKLNAFPYKEKLVTNHYNFLLQNTADLYQFSIDIQPPINDDSIQVLREFVNSMKQTLISQFGFVCHKGKVLWGIKPLKKPLLISRKIQDQTYQATIKQTRILYESDIAKLEGLGLRQVLQVYSVALKEKIVRMGLKEITRGRYFRIKGNQSQELFVQQLKAIRTYELRLVPLMHGISLQIDVGSRVLTTDNFLQTLTKCKSVDQKRKFVGQIVECNYGNRNSYKIVDINFNKSPLDQFSQQKIQSKISYIKYYQSQYKIKVRQKNQPLLKVIIRIDREIKEGKKIKKPIQGYLIPQLVRLVGIPQKYLKNQSVMKQIANFTNIFPSKRYKYTSQIINQFNKEKGFMKVQKYIEADGFVLPNPTIVTSNERQAQNGSINIKDKLKDPMKLKKESWLFVYSLLSEDYRDDEDDAQDLVNGFQKAQNMYGINIQPPKFVYIEKNGVEEWKTQISKNYKDNAMVVLFFTDRQKSYYDELKRFLTNQVKAPSQVVLRKNLDNKGQMSIFSKIICQMNAKLGKALWVVPPKHPFWKDKTIVIGGLSISKGKNGHTLAFVGTYSRDFTKTYGNSLTRLPSRENIAEKVYQDLFADWIKKYNEFQNAMPAIIILYREGLSDQQIKIQGQKQLSAINRVIVRANKKFAGYNPQIVYTVVNKKVKSKFYSTGDKGNSIGKFRPQIPIQNPQPGTIVFQPLSTENAYDFHLAAQKVTQGTSAPTHYRIAYDSSKIPQEAIAQLTYEQCYNYFNWFGAVRVPGCLQNADKLSKLVGEHIKENIASSNLLKTPYYL